MDVVDAAVAALDKNEDRYCKSVESPASCSRSSSRKDNLRNTSYVNAIGKDAEDLLVYIAESIGLKILHNVEDEELFRNRGVYRVSGHTKSQNSSRTPKSSSRRAPKSASRRAPKSASRRAPKSASRRAPEPASRRTSKSASRRNPKTASRLASRSTALSSSSTSSSSSSSSSTSALRNDASSLSSISSSSDSDKTECDSTEFSYESGISMQSYNLRKTKAYWQKKYNALTKSMNSRSDAVMVKVMDVLSKLEKGKDEEELFCGYLKFRLSRLDSLYKHVVMFKLHEVLSRELREMTFETSDDENLDVKLGADVRNFDITKEIGKMKKQIEKLESKQVELEAQQPAVENVLSCI